jgi:GNAT superfamily N-acetyltransferase
MKIRIAHIDDLLALTPLDRHIAEAELRSIISQGRVLIAEDQNGLVGWMRWNLFFDSIPFITMLFFLEPFRGLGYGTGMVQYWEGLMKDEQYQWVMTSTQSNESGQHFWRKMGYRDCGGFLPPGEVLEIMMIKQIRHDA